MGLDNRSAQRQSDAETFGLVGRQRQKCIFNELGRKSGSGIHDSHFDKIGVEDLCIVETDDALLVMKRDRSQDVRLIVEELQRRSHDDKL